MASGGVADEQSGTKPGLFARFMDLTDTDARPIDGGSDSDGPTDILAPDERRKREKFIPVTRFALLDRLTKPRLWENGDAGEARRFFRYLDYWRQQQYNALLLKLEQNYEAFSPDTDLLLTRSFSETEREHLQQQVIDDVEHLLIRANYERIDPSDVELILTRDSHYGLDLYVDMKAFEHIVIYYRGASNRRYEQRRYAKFLRKEQFDVPIFQRLFIMFKLKPIDVRVAEVAHEHGISEDEARKKVRKIFDRMPPGLNHKNIYLKLFKNIPRTDVEMVFPNTEVRFRALDKLRLGAMAGGGIGMGAVGAAGKIALLATNPVAAAGAVVGLGGVAARQAMGFMNQKQRYMVVMAQNLYFHTMADNRGVILKIAARGAEEDVKEEMLLYSVLAKVQASHAELPAIDLAIENYLDRTFGVKVDFDVEDALGRLVADGIVTINPNGTFTTLPPAEAASHIDQQWDIFLDQLPDQAIGEGHEFESAPGAASA